MSKKKPITKKKQLKNHVKSYNFLVIFAVMLGMMAGVLMVKVFYQGEPRITVEPTVTIGALEYDFSKGKAVKRDNPNIASLKVFLEEAAAKDCSAVHDFMEPSQYAVMAATKDVSQVLLGYGCGDTSARMFAVYEDGAWRMISPTNSFDIYNIPVCSYLKDNAISKQIAPVCFEPNGTKEKRDYLVR